MLYGVSFNMVVLMLYFLSFVSETFTFLSVGTIQDVSKIHGIY
jgi:hypothetical protein